MNKQYLIIIVIGVIVVGYFMKSDPQPNDFDVCGGFAGLPCDGYCLLDDYTIKDGFGTCIPQGKINSCLEVPVNANSGVGMANPASVFCQCIGGDTTNKETASGQVGLCNGLDEWELYRLFEIEN